MVFDMLQLTGGIILSFGYIPQVIQIIKTKSVEDLNLNTFALIFVGILFMEVYAVNLVINKVGHMFLVTNSMALVLSGLVTLLIIRYRKSTGELINEND